MKRKIGLVLGSGGARGLAHIGVIKELDRRGYEIRSIVGTSMGALVGGCYAAKKLSAYEDWVVELKEWDILKFLDVSLTTRQGMLKGDLIMSKLRGLIGEVQIDDLSIEYTAIATDIRRQREIWISSGDLFAAIRASIAVPGLFTPLAIGERLLVDGGLLNPLPVAPATHDPDLQTVAVSLAGAVVAEPLGSTQTSSAVERKGGGYRQRIDEFIERVQSSFGVERDDSSESDESHKSISDVLISAFTTMQNAIARYHLAAYPPDLLIEIPVNTCETHEFYKARSLIKAGEYWAAKALDEWNPDAG